MNLQEKVRMQDKMRDLRIDLDRVLERFQEVLTRLDYLSERLSDLEARKVGRPRRQ